MTKLEEWAAKNGYTHEYAEDFIDGTRAFVREVMERAMKPDSVMGHIGLDAAFDEVVAELGLEEPKP